MFHYPDRFRVVYYELSFNRKYFAFLVRDSLVGLGGLGVTCSPRDPRFAGSKPAEVDGFFQGVKILRFQAR